MAQLVNFWSVSLDLSHNVHGISQLVNFWSVSLDLSHNVHGISQLVNFWSVSLDLSHNVHGICLKTWGYVEVFNPYKQHMDLCNSHVQRAGWPVSGWLCCMANL